MKERDALLVDTSAWIEGFLRDGSVSLQTYLLGALDSDLVFISRIVILELVQGCKEEEDRQTLQQDLNGLHLVELSPQTWRRSYDLAFLLRRKGVTIPTVDILVGAQAIQHNLLLLHHDRHFELMALHSSLRTKTFLGKHGKER